MWIERLTQQTNEFAFVEVLPTGVINDWYGASELLFGYGRDEAIGQLFDIVYTEEDRAARIPAHELSVARTQGRAENDRWHRRKDSSTFWGSGVIQPIRDDAGQLLGFCKVIRNRTDLRTQIEALENRVALEDARENERKETLVVIAHELRNPMGAIASAGHLLERAADDLARARAAAILARQMSVLKRLVDDLSGLTQPQVNGRFLTIKPFEVQSAISTAMEGLVAQAAAHGQVLNLILPEVPLVIEADEERFEQMLMNLVGNALKYTPDGRVTVSATVEGKSLAVRIEDNGVGIAPEALRHIFELFTREVQGKQAPEGLGVGLAVVKELARAHGGGIEARSLGKGLGSVFTLRLPMRAPAFLNHSRLLDV